MVKALTLLAALAYLCWTGGPSGQARADDGGPSNAPAGSALAPQITASDAKGVFTTDGTASIAAPRRTVFAVLMDYAHMTSFIKSLKSSTVSARHGNVLTVVQEAIGKAGPFSREVHTVLQVTGKPNSKITFVDTEQKDFYQYSGSWALHGSGKTTTVAYQLIAKLKGMAPEGITEGAFKKNVETMMVEIRTEAEKRAAAH